MTAALYATVYATSAVLFIEYRLPTVPTHRLSVLSGSDPANHNKFMSTSDCNAL